VNSTLKSLSILLIVIFITSCGVSRESSQPQRSTPDSPALITVTPENERRTVQQQLNSAHQDWKGTPYILGGSGRNGVDCSSFTQIVYRDYFGLDLPRHTSRQLQEGTGVRRSHIRPGDLIFFRTARGVLHVGIAMEDGDFLHASVSSGVMISNIRENYWASIYIGARRVF
jgi:cell wall-associated NlpC family hydrolase